MRLHRRAPCWPKRLFIFWSGSRSCARATATVAIPPATLPGSRRSNSTEFLGGRGGLLEPDRLRPVRLEPRDLPLAGEGERLSDYRETDRRSSIKIRPANSRNRCWCG